MSDHTGNNVNQIDEINVLVCLRVLARLSEVHIYTQGRFDPTLISGHYSGWLKGIEALVTPDIKTKFEASSDKKVFDRRWSEKRDLWLATPYVSAWVHALELIISELVEVLRAQPSAMDKVVSHVVTSDLSPLFLGAVEDEACSSTVVSAVKMYLDEAIARESNRQVCIAEVGGGSTRSLCSSLHDYSGNIRSFVRCVSDGNDAVSIPEWEGLSEQYRTVNLETFLAEPENTRRFDLLVLDSGSATDRVIQSTRLLLKDEGLLLLCEWNTHSWLNQMTLGLLECIDQAKSAFNKNITPFPTYLRAHKTILLNSGYQSTFALTGDHSTACKAVLLAEASQHYTQDHAHDHAYDHDPINSRTDDNHLLGGENSHAIEDKHSAATLKAFVTGNVRRCLAEVVSFPEEEIHVKDSFQDFGVDSLVSVSLIKSINTFFHVSLKTIVLFDYATVEDLTRHLIDECRSDILAHPDYRSSVESSTQNRPSPQSVPEAPKAETQTHKSFSTKRAVFRQSTPLPADQVDTSKKVSQEPIAIIGLSGRFAQSSSVEALWQHLADGDELTEKVTRWNINEKVEGIDPSKLCQYGSFIKDYDQFDPQFFNIAHIEATFMDPQQRVFLEESWTALEDAGYVGSAIEGQRCGVYVGCNSGDYTNLFYQNQFPAQAFWGNAGSILPARIAYYLDLKGPAVAVDTACSSSLVAIHLACQALRTQEVDYALAGGVFVQSSAEFYHYANRAGMLSPSGRCHSFDARADGFVPGEGAGVIVLKRLSDAQRDGDTICGVIAGSASNQDGATSGITAPSANSQERLEREVYDRYGIDASSIQMLEAHGTGTVLGDPIEFEALTRAFRKDTELQQFCALGSIKSNLGHTATAAGVSGVLKILMSMKHRQIPPSLHFEQGNPNIDFEQSPFYVNTSLRDWPQIKDRQGKLAKRRAAISSFGFSGTNVHMVIDEGPTQTRVSPQRPGYLVVLSAYNRLQLVQLIEKMRDYCQRIEALDMGHLSFTLMQGRKHHNVRMACVVSNQDELLDMLRCSLDDQLIDGQYQGDLAQSPAPENTPSIDFGEQCLNRTLDAQGQDYIAALKGLANLFCQGYELNYAELFQGDHFARISLPTCVFAKQRFWVNDTAGGVAEAPQSHTPESHAPQSHTPESHTPEQMTRSRRHPLIHLNTSNFDEQSFCSIFTGAEPFLQDHQVHGQALLPGVAYLEMARTAINESVTKRSEQGQWVLSKVQWLQPMHVNDGPQTVKTALKWQGDEHLHFEISSEVEEGLIYSQGQARWQAANTIATLDVQQLKSELAQRYTGQDCYRMFEQLGIVYGPSHQGIKQLWAGDHAGQMHVLAQLELAGSATQVPGPGGYYVDPGLFDSALQAALGLMFGQEEPAQLAIPRSLEQVAFYGDPGASAWAWVRRHDSDQKDDDKQVLVDIDICDAKGEVKVRLVALALHVLAQRPSLVSPLSQGVTNPSINHRENDCDTHHYLPQWRSVDVAIPHVNHEQQRLILLCEYPHSATDLQTSLNAFGDQCELMDISDHVTGDLAYRYQCYSERLLKALQNTHAELVQLVLPASERGQLLRGLSAMLRTAQQENPGSQMQCVELPTEWNVAELTQRLSATSRLSEQHIRFEDGQALASAWQHTNRSDAEHPWRNQGVYLITGGLGGLGLIFARDIAKKVNRPSIILTGRRQHPENMAQTISELQELGAQVEYAALDVSNAQAVKNKLANIEANYGALHGIFHSAGVLRDSLLNHKTVDELSAVFAPKVTGITVLDEASRHMSLDFFAACSSAAGALGNVGQADYSAANSFMDSYLTMRENWVQAGLRHGRSLSVNWPLWAEGGMRLSTELERLMWQKTGMKPMPSADGLHSFYCAFARSKQSQVLVMHGDPQRLAALVGTDTSVGVMAEHVFTDQALTDQAITPPPQALIDRASEWIKPIFSRVTGMPLEGIDTHATFERFGIDSIMIVNITEGLEKIMGELPKTLLFECQSIHELAIYIATEKSSVFKGETQGNAGDSTQDLSRNQTTGAPPRKTGAASGVNTQNKAVQKTARVKKQTEEGVAIVGLSGRYPHARNMNEFWDNLKSGRNCVSELPEGRWQLDGLDGLESAIKNTYGGFIDGVDEFDPLFFRINPRDAELIDPQERLFLQCAYETLEDAGYTPQSLINNACSANNQFLNDAIGVYVGVMYEEYQMYGVQSTMGGNPVALGGNPSSIANRVSYTFNFHGPSMAVDTMCSSALTAIHLACDAIARGDCEAAIAGGVNVSVHPNKYIFLNQGNFMSSDGRCVSFGEGGDGYVPGEGVGSVLLKPLSKAIADGDRIYGVIKGSALNHGGKTSGYTVPQPNAQAEVIQQAYRKAGVSPGDVSYIEAHGTGTSLGDPIEISGLSKVFGRREGEQALCAIGSVKSNIGHCESAAGIAGLSKILLQMKEQTLVPSLHSTTLNPNIDFSRTPFKVQAELERWSNPVVVENGQKTTLPRIAGLSSFGAGGSNAHLIVEEYCAEPIITDSGQNDYEDDCRAELILLSAVTQDQLRQRARDLLEHISQHQYQSSELPSVAYTLALGRESLDLRTAFIVDSFEGLSVALESYLSGEATDSVVDEKTSALGESIAFSSPEEQQRRVDDLFEKMEYQLPLELWVKGKNVNWQKWYADKPVRKLALPTYPFAREKYWFMANRAAATKGSVLSNTTTVAQTPSIIDIKTSDFFYRDHQIQGRNIVPAAMYLELVRAATQQHAEEKGFFNTCIRIKDIIWLKPLGDEEIKRPIQIRITEEKGELAFAVLSESGTLKKAVHCEGRLDIFSAVAPESIDIEALKSLAFESVLMQSDVYELFERLGFLYGPSMQAIQEVRLAEDFAVAKIVVPNVGEPDHSAFTLHPAVLDSAFQAVIGRMMSVSDQNNMAGIPVAVGSVDVFKQCTNEMWVHISEPEGSAKFDHLKTYDLQLFDHNGQCCVEIHDFAVRMFEVSPQVRSNIGLYVPEWMLETVTSLAVERESKQSKKSDQERQAFLILDMPSADSRLREGIAEIYPSADVEAYSSVHETLIEKQKDYYAEVFTRVKTLLQTMSGKQCLTIIVPWQEQGHLLALSALTKSACWENPDFRSEIVAIDTESYAAYLEDLTVVNKRRLRETEPVSELAYIQGKRQVKCWKKANEAFNNSAPITRPGGVYLITGGTGGLGEVFAKHVAKTTRAATLVLTGRSPSSKRIDKLLSELEQVGCEAEYIQCDVTDASSVKNMVYQVLGEYGQINGIYHCAGIKNDSFIIYKKVSEAQTVIAAKIDGLINIDLLTRCLVLDFFVGFSSVAAITGNLGQADYGFGNAFMDSYMVQRNQLVETGDRYGKSLSVNWPLWRADGMQVDESVQKTLEAAGMVTLSAEEGVRVLDRAFNLGASNVAVAGEGFGSIVKTRPHVLENEQEKTPNDTVDVKPITLAVDSTPLGIVASSLTVKFA